MKKKSSAKLLGNKKMRIPRYVKSMISFKIDDAVNSKT